VSRATNEASATSSGGLSLYKEDALPPGYLDSAAVDLPENNDDEAIVDLNTSFESFQYTISLFCSLGIPSIDLRERPEGGELTP
jgi:hypothetical protein